LKGFQWNLPVWLFGLLSFIVLFWLTPFFAGRTERFDGFAVLITVGIFFLCGVIAWIISVVFSMSQGSFNQRKPREVRGSRSADLSELSQSPQELFEWLNKEEPVSSPDQDRFDMAVFARRIVKVLTGYPLKTVGLVGPYGCGKSSVLSMVQHYIQNGREESAEYRYDKIIICWVSGWGFREGTAAKHILKAAIKELSRHTDCVGLEIVPENYRRAMLGSDNAFVRFVAALLSGWQSPTDVLKKIDAVLCRINKRLVVFLEDIDRNKRTDLFFNEISAFLDGLKGLNYISFVLAIGEEHKGQEVVIKTAEHLEVIPNLPRTHVLDTCKSFRARCLESLNNKVKCIPDQDRDNRMGADRSEMGTEFVGFDKSLSKPIDYIARLTNNPGVLKAALRRTKQVWDSLCGEIDFDDLFMATVLRAATPEVFFFINQNIEPIRALIADARESKDRADKSREDLHTEFKPIMDGADYDKEAAEGLMVCLFPGWRKDYIDSYPSMREPLRNYQLVENSWPTDYWARLVREELLPDEISDQEILRAIHQWNNNRSAKAYRGMNMRDTLLSGDGVFDKIRQFRELIEGNTLRGLAEEQFAITLSEKGNKANSDNCPAANEWWLLMPEDLSEDSAWNPWLLQQIYKAIPVSLTYVNDLYSTWFRHFTVLRGDIVKEAKKVYENNSDILLRALDPERIYTVSIFSHHYSLPKQGGSGFNPKDWQWLATVLLEAGEKKPDVIIPQIAGLLCDQEITTTRPDSDRPVHGWKAIFIEDRPKSLFTNNYEKLMELLSNEIDISKYGVQEQESITTAQL